MKTINHELMSYDYNESTSFVGMMPLAAEKTGTIGASNVSVEMHGHLANGVDALEVIDMEKVFETTETVNEASEVIEENTELDVE